MHHACDVESIFLIPALIAPRNMSKGLIIIAQVRNFAEIQNCGGGRWTGQPRVSGLVANSPCGGVPVIACPISPSILSLLPFYRRALSSKVATYNQRVVSEGDSLAQEVRTLHCHALLCRLEVSVVAVVRSRLVQITELSKEIDVALQNSTDITVTEELQRARAIVQGHGPGGDLRKLCKQNSPFLLSLLLGKRTNVVTLQV